MNLEDYLAMLQRMAKKEQARQIEQKRHQRRDADDAYHDDFRKLRH